MPTGVYQRKTKETKLWNCKKCSGVTFTNMGDLRKHQWSKHTETFANLIAAASTQPPLKNKRGRPKKNQFAELIPQTTLEKSVRELKNGDHIVLPLPVSVQPAGDMKVSELLAKLKDQRTFLIDVVNLIEGIVKG